MEQHLDDFVLHGLSSDDVFNSNFLNGILVLGPGRSLRARQVPTSWKGSWVHVIEQNDSSALPSPGPYLLDKGKLTPVYRLYQDIQNAFNMALRRSSHQRYLTILWALARGKMP